MLLTAGKIKNKVVGCIHWPSFPDGVTVLIPEWLFRGAPWKDSRRLPILIPVLLGARTGDMLVPGSRRAI